MRSSGCSTFNPEKNALRMPRICNWCASVDVAIVFSASMRSLVSTSLVVSFAIVPLACSSELSQRDATDAFRVGRLMTDFLRRSGNVLHGVGQPPETGHFHFHDVAGL